MMTKTGKALVDDFGFDPASARFFSDPLTLRDTDAAFAIMQGMGIKHGSIDFDADLFIPPCLDKFFDFGNETLVELLQNEMREGYALAPLPGDYKADLNELQEIIGVGPAGRLEDIDGPDAGIVFDDEGKPTGALDIMAKFSMTMLFAYASNIPYLNITFDQINKFYAWHAWSVYGIWFYNSYFTTQQVWLLHSILDGLKSGSATNIYLGHDSTIGGFAPLLDLKWDAAPYSFGKDLKPVPPGSALLFEFDDENNGAVTVTFVWKVFDHSDDDFQLSHSEAGRWASMAEFEQAIERNLQKFLGAKECFDEAPTAVLV
jgi:hypothetical protein